MIAACPSQYRFVAIGLLLLAWVAKPACRPPESATGCAGGRQEQVLHVREGVDSLRAHLSVPEVLPQARWVARSKGVPSRTPGPTDLELWAFFPLSPQEWTRLEPRLGARLAAEPVSIDAVVAEALLPHATLQDAARRNGAYELRGERWPTRPFENVSWSGGWAIRLPVGLVIDMHSN